MSPSRRWVSALFPSSRKPSPSRVGLRVERLEEWVVPAPITWNTATSPTGGDIGLAANWVGGLVPGPGDDAIISLASAGTVTYNTNAPLTVGSVTTNANSTFSVAKGAFTIAASGKVGTLTGPVTVASGATLTAGTGAKVQLGGVTTVAGTLSANSPASFAVVRGQYQSNSNGVAVTAGGLLQLTNATLGTFVPNNYNGTTYVTVAANAGFKSAGSTFDLSWGSVSLDPAANLGAGDVTGSSFLTNLSTPTRFLPLLANNAQFYQVSLVGSTLANSSLTVGPLGKDTSAQYYFFQPGFAVAATSTLTFTAGTKAYIGGQTVMPVNGTLTFNSPAGLTVFRGQYSSYTSGFAVGTGGSLQLTNATVSSTDPSYQGTTSITVAASGGFKSSNSVIGLSRVDIDPSAAVGTADITGTALDATLSTPTRLLPGLAGNVRFAAVELAGATTDASVSVGVLGTSSTQQFYDFPSDFTVTGGTALRFTAGAKVQVEGRTNLTVNGILSLTSPAGVVFARGQYASYTGQVSVGTGGLLQLSAANVSASNPSYQGKVQIVVAAGAGLQAAGSTIAVDNVYLSTTSALNPGDVTDTAFDADLTIAPRHLPLLGGNKRFAQVKLIGATTDATLTLSPLGADPSNQSYVFPAAGADAFIGTGTFTVTAGTSLTAAPGTKLLLEARATVAVSGNLTVDTPALLVGVRGQYTSYKTTLAVNAGGRINLTKASLTLTNPGNGGSVDLVVNSGGTFATSDSTYAWDSLTIDPGAVVPTGGLTNSAFNLPVTLPLKYQPRMAGNVRFSDVYLTDTTVLPALDVGPVGTDQSSLRYVITGPLTVAAATALNFTPGVRVFLPKPPAGGSPVSVVVNGTLSVDSAASFVAERGVYSNYTTSIAVGNGGKFRATNTVFSLASPANSGAVSVTVAAGGELAGTGNSFGWTDITLLSGSTGRLQFNSFSTKLNLDSGTNLPSNAVQQNDFSGVAVVSKGASTATIDLSNNYWGSSVPAVISTLITDRLSAPVNTRPLVSFTPFLATRPVQTLVVAPASLPYALTDRTIPLAASFRSPSSSGLVPVNGGTVTFTVFDAQTLAVVGTAQTVPVANGSASVSAYPVPAGANAGTYVVKAAFSGFGTYGASTDTSQTLTITPVSTAATARDATRVFAVAAGSVTLAADVTAAVGGAVSQGAVVFRVLNAANVLVGAAYSQAVTGGTATAAYPLPVSLPTGTYTVQAAYGGYAPNLAAAPLATATFTVTPAAAAVVAANATATFSGLNQNVSLSAAVTSPAGPVNDGTVTFTVRNGAGTVINQATGTVVNGSVTPSPAFVLPANTPAQVLTIQADYSSPRNYGPGSDAAHTLTVNQAPQSINFPPVAPTPYSAGLTINLAATGGPSGNPVVFSVLSGPGTVAGAVLTVTGVGNIVVAADQPGTGNYLAAATVQRTVAVGLAAQAISFTQPPAVTFAPGLTVNLAATGGGSGNPVTFSVVSGPGTVAGSTLTVTGAGSVVVQADQAGSASFSAAAAVQRTVVVAKAAQTVTFPAPAGVTFAAGMTVALGATSSSGLAVSYSVVSGPATVVGSTLTVTGAGSVVVRATQAGDANYLAAAAVQQTLTVAQAAQTITFAQPPTVTFAAGLSVSLAATSSSGLAVSYSVVSGPATVAGSTLTVSGAGSVVVRATQAGDANYSAAAAVQQTLTVAQAAQTITFPAPGAVVFAPGLTFPLGATSSSGLAITYAVLSGPGTVAGGILTVTGGGDIVVQATQPGTANYAAAAAVQQTVTVNPAAQTISFPALAPVVYAPGRTVTLAAAGGGSASLVVFSVVSGPGTVAGGTLTVTGAGAVVVQATQAGDANYQPAAPVQQTLTVSQAAQTISFPTPAGVVFAPGLAVSLTATSSSGLAVGYTVVSGPGTVAGSTLTVTGAGSVVVRATQPGDANYSAAAAAQQTVTVAKGSQVLTFAGPAPVVYAPGLAVSLTAAGGGSASPVVFSVVSGPGTVAGSTLAVSGAGSVVVRATQAGDANYQPAAPVQQTLTVSQAAQTITFPALPAVTFAPGLQVSLTAGGGGSGNPVTYTVVSGPGVLSGSTLTVTGAGNILVEAGQPGDANYAAAAAVRQTLGVAPAPQVVSFPPLAPVTFAPGLTVSLAAAGGGSGLPVAFSVVSGPATVTGATLTVTGAGTVVVRAAQLGNVSYSPAAPVEQTLAVVQAAQIVSFPAPPAVTFAPGLAVPLGAASSSGLAVSYTVVSGPGTVAGGTLTVTGAGGIVVEATQAGDGNFAPAAPVRRTVGVAPAAQVIDFAPPAGVTFAPGLTVALAATGGPAGTPVVFNVVSGPGTVAGATLTVTGAGPVVVEATQAGTADYAPAAPVRRAVAVAPSPQTVAFTPPALTQVFSPAPQPLTAASSSGLAVAFRVLSGPATVTGNQLTLTGAGTVVVEAVQAGDANYAPAAARQTVTVTPRPAPVITFTPPPAVAYAPGATINLAAGGGAGGPVVFSVVSGPGTLAGSVLTVTGPGTVVVQADQPGDATTAAASSVRRSITVTGGGGGGGGTTPKPGVSQIAVGDGAGGTVRLLNADRSVRLALTPFAGFAGAVRTAAADLTGDGVAELVAGTGPGAATDVRVYDGATQRLLFEVQPFEAAFTGGVYVAAGDVTGDGVSDLLVSPDQGGGPRVRVFDGRAAAAGTVAQAADFFGIDDASFRGGARVAAADLTGDGKAEVVVSAGYLGGPRVTVWDGGSVAAGGPAPLANFFAFEDSLRNGAFVAAGDVTGDGRADLVFGGGPSGGPRVRLFDGAAVLAAGGFATADAIAPQAQLANFFAGDPAGRGGVRVAVKDFGGQGGVVAADGTTGRVRGYTAAALRSGGDPAEAWALDAPSGVLDGVYVG